MEIDMESFKDRIRFWTVFLGILQITVGCLVGFIPPTAVEWFRGIVMAHIEFTINGILMIVFGFLVPFMKLGVKPWKAWFSLLQIGTWSNGLAGVFAAFIGYSSAFMVTINEKFPAPRGNDHPLVTATLQVCGVTIMLTLFMTLYGFYQGRNK